MQTTLISAVMTAIIKALPADLLKEGLDKFIDWLENKIEKSESKLDDATLFPLLTALRRQLGIEETPGSKYEDNPESTGTPPPTPEPGTGTPV